MIPQIIIISSVFWIITPVGKPSKYTLLKTQMLFQYSNLEVFYCVFSEFTMLIFHVLTEKEVHF